MKKMSVSGVLLASVLAPSEQEKKKKLPVMPSAPVRALRSVPEHTGAFSPVK